MRSPLSICTLLPSESLALSLQQLLGGERFVLTQHQSQEEFLNFVQQRKQQLDCLVIEDEDELFSVINQLHEQGILLPTLILKADTAAIKHRLTSSMSPDKPYLKEKNPSLPLENPNTTQEPNSGNAGFYHTAALLISTTQLSEIAHYIDLAIDNFLKLSSGVDLSKSFSVADTVTQENLLLQQQRRLTEKLRERLGYLGVYYKRNTKNFFRHLPSGKRQELLELLKSEYRQIVLDYFRADNNLNQKIDEFVNVAFFADIPVTYIVEIHMELMDELSKHLKLEGRSDEVLLDYRLTLIDVIAHLCEMYRRSLPKES